MKSSHLFLTVVLMRISNQRQIDMRRSFFFFSRRSFEIIFQNEYESSDVRGGHYHANTFISVHCSYSNSSYEEKKSIETFTKSSSNVFIDCCHMDDMHRITEYTEISLDKFCYSSRILVLFFLEYFVYVHCCTQSYINGNYVD